MAAVLHTANDRGFESHPAHYGITNNNNQNAQWMVGGVEAGIKSSAPPDGNIPRLFLVLYP
jgi:hypothetical protein